MLSGVLSNIIASASSMRRIVSQARAFTNILSISPSKFSLEFLPLPENLPRFILYNGFLVECSRHSRKCYEDCA
jgi:hypothetical protein